MVSSNTEQQYFDMTTTPPPPPPLWILATINAADAAETLSVAAALVAFRFDDGSSLSPPQAALLSTAVYIGMLLGGLCGGRLGDHGSKRRLLVWCLALDCISGIIAFFSPFLFSKSDDVFVLLCLCRLGAGVGVGASIPVIFAIVGESTSADRKARDVNVLALGWSLGSVFSAFVSWIILRNGETSYHHWNIVILFGSAPALFAMTALSIESVTTKRRTNVVHTGLRMSPRPNIASTPPRQVPLLSITHSLSTPKLIPLMVAWFTLAYATYGVSTWIASIFDSMDSFSNTFFASLLFSLAQLPGNMISSFLPLMFPNNRRTIVIISAGFSVLALMLATIVQVSGSGNTIFVLASCFFASSSAVSWTTLDLASTEAFPSSTNLGIATASGRLGSIIANSLNPFLVAHNLVLFVAAVAVFVSGLSALHFTPGAAGSSSSSHEIMSTRPIQRDADDTDEEEILINQRGTTNSSSSVMREEERDTMIVIDMTIPAS